MFLERGAVQQFPLLHCCRRSLGHLSISSDHLGGFWNVAPGPVGWGELNSWTPSRVRLISLEVLSAQGRLSATSFLRRCWKHTPRPEWNG